MAETELPVVEAVEQAGTAPTQGAGAVGLEVAAAACLEALEWWLVLGGLAAAAVAASPPLALPEMAESVAAGADASRRASVMSAALGPAVTVWFFSCGLRGTNHEIRMD